MAFDARPVGVHMGGRSRVEIRPGPSQLVPGLAAVEGHLVGERPAGDGGMVLGPAHELADQEALLGEHPAVAVEVPALPPGTSQLAPDM